MYASPYNFSTLQCENKASWTTTNNISMPLFSAFHCELGSWMFQQPSAQSPGDTRCIVATSAVYKF